MSDRTAPASWHIATLPNAISALRLCAVPVVVWLALGGAWWGAFGLFVLAGVSDALDGWLARRGAASQLGAVLDPLADKALLVGMIVTLASLGVLPRALAVLVVARDLLIVGGALAMAGAGAASAVRPLRIGKLHTALQIVLVGTALFLCGLGLRAPLALGGLVWAVVASTLLSGFAYGWSILRLRA